MTGYTKLFQEILSSSVWGEDDKTRIVWITILAARGPDNIVRASYSGLAHLARVSVEDARKAVAVLESPDDDSRSKEFEGRRIEKVDGGWLVLNGGKYREARSQDERREYMRKYMADYRKTKEPVNNPVNNRKQKLKNVNPVSLDRDRADTETETISGIDKSIPSAAKAARRAKGNEFIKPSFEELKTHVLEMGMTANDAEHVWNVWEENGWTRTQGGKRIPITSWKGCLATWKTGFYFPSQRATPGGRVKPSPHGKPPEDRKYDEEF